jgi:hypothetical protein
MLHDSISGQKRLVLHGLSGVGKSSLASRYALAYRKQYKGIFWVSAATAASLETCYQEIDQLLQRKCGKNLVEWCAADESEEYLLIIDNVDDPGIFLDETKLKLSHKLPLSDHGHVILTSTRSDLQDLGTMVSVDPLEEQDAVDLLLYRSSGRTITNHDGVDALAIVRLLGHLPLAIEQCGAFISAEHSTLDRYSTSFDSVAAVIDLSELETDYDSFQVRMSRKSILSTWEISFTRLTDVDPDAATLLAMLAFFDRRGVRESVLLNGFQERRRWQPDGSSSRTFFPRTPQFVTQLHAKKGGRGVHYALQKLVTYSLLSRTATTPVAYKMHPVSFIM